LIDKQILGKIISISASFNIDLMPGENFRFKKELSGGGPLRDLGTHVIDLFRYFNGEIVSVKSFGDNVVYKSEVEDFTSAIVKFEKGGYGNFNVSYSVHKSFNRIEIIGSNGCIGIDDFIGKKNISSKMIIDLQSEKKKTFRFRANKQIYILKAMQKSLLREENTPVYGMDALINMKIMEAIEKDFSNSGTSI